LAASLFAFSGVLWGSTEREKKTMTKINTVRAFGRMLALPLAIAAAGLSLAAPAQAQMRDHADQRGPAWQGNHPGNHQGNRPDNRGPAWQLTPARNTQIRQDIANLRMSIDRAAARRTISQREASGLRNEARSIQQLYQGYSRNGLTRAEVRTLQDRVNRVRVALRMERRDWDGQRG